MVLNRSQVQAFYDRFGKKLDAQAFYEDAALDDLIAHAAFEEAANIFEFGCGTGRMALRLLTQHLSSSASYLGIDLSHNMISIAAPRIATYTERATVVQSDAAICFPLPDHSVDRVVATYVLDLLSEIDIRLAISEAHRLLEPGGKLCLVSLTTGETFPSRILSALWSQLFRLHAPWVGGCRPIRLTPLFQPRDWSLNYHNLVTRFGVPSEVLIAIPMNVQGPFETEPGSGCVSI